MIYIGNGHAGWEAALANMLAPGDRALVPRAGASGSAGPTMARRMGVDVEIIDFGFAARSTRDRSPSGCAPTAGGAIKAVLTVQTDTASSVRNDVAALRARDRRGRAPGAARRRLHRMPRAATASRWTPGAST